MLTDLLLNYFINKYLIYTQFYWFHQNMVTFFPYHNNHNHIHNSEFNNSKCMNE